MRGTSSESSEGLPRKLTAVGTVGDVNQLFTVYEKNWNCSDCGQENYAARLVPLFPNNFSSVPIVFTSSFSKHF